MVAYTVVPQVHVVVQFYPWFNFHFLLFLKETELN